MTVENETGLAELSKADLVVAKFKPYMELKVVDVNDKAGLKKVHDARMEVRRVRIDLEKSRKALVEDSVAFQKKVNAEAKRINGIIEPIETHLENQEAIVEREKERLKKIEEDRQREILTKRLNDLAAVGFAINPTFVQMMNEDDFGKLLAEKTAAFEAEQQRKIEEAAKAEAERKRLAQERAEFERQKAEADRLERERQAVIEAERKERERAEAEARAEIQRHQAELKAERERLERLEFERQAKERAEAEAKARVEREAKEAAERAERDRIAEQERLAREAEEQNRIEAEKPDREKLRELAANLRSVGLLQLKTKSGKACLSSALVSINEAVTKLEAF
jgi:septal ring factor EnvC (AmiA/AmiB activator)